MEIAVHRMFRNRGFGKAIMHYIFKNGIDKGMSTARLHVYRDNAKAFKLYRKLGFKEVKSIGHWIKS